uniref:Uncharacterized protein n=1 Tax=Sphaerodactylus townsendi TaxID=933632 RepID=A0ACB8FMA8_9SAUR
MDGSHRTAAAAEEVGIQHQIPPITSSSDEYQALALPESGLGCWLHSAKMGTSKPCWPLACCSLLGWGVGGGTGSISKLPSHPPPQNQTCRSGSTGLGDKHAAQ